MDRDVRSYNIKTGYDKIQQYGWKTVDKPGVFLHIPKDQLLIDDRYQREVGNHQRRILNMAAKWSWIACTALTVADRDGKFFVMDGQCRKLAADRRSDIKELPCMVYDTADTAAEAQGFLDINVDRRSILATQKFKALTMVEDPDALFVEDLLKTTGHTVGGNGAYSAVKCAGVLLRAAELDRDALRRIWGPLAQLCTLRQIPSDLVAGCFSLERRALDGVSLSRSPWRERFVRVGAERMNEAIARAKAYYIAGGANAVADGIASAMNRGVRHSRVEFAHNKAADEVGITLREPVRDLDPAYAQ